MDANTFDLKSLGDVLLCRACLQSYADEDFLDTNVTYDDDEGLTYSDCFFLCTQTNLDESNGLPCHLCRNCGLELQIAYDFQKKVREANKILDELFFEEQKPSIDGAHNEMNINSSTHLEAGVFIDVENDFEPSQDETNNEDENEIDAKFDVKFDVEEDEETIVFSCGEEETVELEKSSASIESVDMTAVKVKPSSNLVKKKSSYAWQKPSEEEQSGFCEICNKTFVDPKYLIRHQKIHDPKRQKFQCPECDRVFATSGRLTIHLRSHTGEGFLCPVCSKLFCVRSDLKVHMRFHTREFPYVCEVCGKSFALRGHLNSHISSKHEDLRLSCNECGKLFQNGNSLKMHAFTHTEMPFHCAYCVKRYPTKHKLKFHIKTKHKSEVDNDELESMRQFRAGRQKHTWMKVATEKEMN